jgi:hypothetical protein
VLLAGQIPLHRIEAPLDDLADDVRGHEVDTAGPLREGFPDTLQAGAKVGRQPQRPAGPLGGPSGLPSDDTQAELPTS